MKIRSSAAAALLAAAVLTAGAPSASAAPSTADSVTTAWYEDYLGRSPMDAYSDPGRQYWVNAMNNGLQGSDALWSITHSREYNYDYVNYLYSRHLVRDMDRGAEYWIQGVTAQRFPLEWVEQNILSSPEYVRGYDNYRSSLIYSWYYAILGIEGVEGDRPVSDGEIRYWSNRLDRVGALQTVREIWYTPEAVELRIRSNYYVALDREPSGGEIAYWYPREVESDINVQVLLGSTPEYVSAH